MKRKLIFFLITLPLISCGTSIKPNGQTRYEHVSILSENDPYYQTGFADYVFTGNITDSGTPVTSASGRQRTNFSIAVTESMKGNLSEQITAQYPAYYDSDGTLVLLQGDEITDTGLPEIDHSYIFLGIAQPDASIILSDLYAAVPYTDENYAEYKDYVENQTSIERKRYTSKYEKIPQTGES